MTRYAAHVNRRATSQQESARADQVQNNAGGSVFALDKWKRLDRFLILGADGGTYYVSERELTIDNANVVLECLAEDGLRTVRRIVEISDTGRAPRNDPAIFALAIAAGTGIGVGGYGGTVAAATRKAALEALPKVCRIGTHLFHFANDVEGFRGWGPALRKAIAAWYAQREPRALAYDLVKYQSRDGWGHKDLIKLSHPQAPTAAHKAALAWSARGGTEKMGVSTRKKGGGERGTIANRDALPAIIEAFVEIHADGVDVRRACELIRAHRLPHECVPNELKNRPEIWDALSEHMGLTALMRNLNKMTAVGLLKPLSDKTHAICSKLIDPNALFKARVHPLAVLIALKTYSAGQGALGKLTWIPNPEVVDALDSAFYLAFEAIEPTNKRHLLGVDCSGSMTAPIARLNLTAREGAAAMAMATVRAEKRTHVMGFCGQFVSLPITAKQRLDDVVRTVGQAGFGQTDCALPMIYAAEHKLEVDCFSVYTDNETWFGSVHPFQALRAYRERTGIPAKLVVVGMASTGFTIADPTDEGMLDVVGFDSAAPTVIADFAAEREVCG